KLQKNTNEGTLVLCNCVIYLTLTNFPLCDGGGVLSIIGSITSLSLCVEILRFLFSYTSFVRSITFKTRCFVIAEPNIIVKSVNGDNLSRIAFSNVLITTLSFDSTVSHLFTKTTNPFRFF